VPDERSQVLETFPPFAQFNQGLISLFNAFEIIYILDYLVLFFGGKLGVVEEVGTLNLRALIIR
jgi:hypothetical protein